jgi:hypothetical protein
MDPDSPSHFIDSRGNPRKRKCESTEPAVVKKVIKNITYNNHNTYNINNYFAPAAAPAAAQGVVVAEQHESNTQMAVSKEQLREWRERWSAIRDNPGKYQQMGYNPEFKALREECAKKGYKPCASQACRNPVQRTTTGFSTHKNRDDKLQPRCKECGNGVGSKEASAAARKSKRERNEEVDATVVKEATGNVEDEAVENCLVPLLRSLGRETHVNVEFRMADMGARPQERLEERGNEYMQIQVKSDGAYKVDGKTAKPNNSKQGEGGGVSKFGHCKDYEDKTMLLVKTREVVEEGEKRLVRKLWIADGASVNASLTNSKSGCLQENADGSLGRDRLPAYDPDDPKDRVEIDAKLRELDAAACAKGHLRTIEQMWYDIPHEDHRKEATLYLALRAAGIDLHMPAGNQRVYDCVQTMPDGGESKIQLKTYNLKCGAAHMSHRVNGVKGRPYSETDDIDDVIIGAIVAPDKNKGGDPYRLVYARFDKDALLKNGVFRHDGYRGHPASQGKESLSMPKVGIYHKWLHHTGGKQHPDKNNKWLAASRYGWHRPVEIDPKEAKIPPKWLEEAAQAAGHPKASPSEEEMTLEEIRMQESLTAHAAAQMRRAGKAVGL